jgi:hypothetical protein
MTISNATFTLRTGFSSCSPTAYVLTYAVKLSSTQHDDVRVALYAGFSDAHKAWITVAQVRTGEGRTAQYWYAHAYSMADMNTPVFKAMKLRASWKKSSEVLFSFCGLRMWTLPLADNGEVRVYALKNDRTALITAVRIGEGRTAEYSYQQVQIPGRANDALRNLTTFFNR